MSGDSNKLRRSEIWGRPLPSLRLVGRWAMTAAEHALDMPGWGSIGPVVLDPDTYEFDGVPAGTSAAARAGKYATVLAIQADIAQAIQGDGDMFPIEFDDEEVEHLVASAIATAKKAAGGPTEFKNPTPSSTR